MTTFKKSSNNHWVFFAQIQLLRYLYIFFPMYQDCSTQFWPVPGIIQFACNYIQLIVKVLIVLIRVLIFCMLILERLVLKMLILTIFIPKKIEITFFISYCPYTIESNRTSIIKTYFISHCLYPTKSSNISAQYIYQKSIKLEK